MSDVVVPNGWRHEDNALRREFTFENFADAFAFMTSVADMAETADHHPDWSNAWNKVDVNLSTHSSNGLTELDMQMARAMDLFALQV